MKYKVNQMRLFELFSQAKIGGFGFKVHVSGRSFSILLSVLVHIWLMVFVHNSRYPIVTSWNHDCHEIEKGT